MRILIIHPGPDFSVSDVHRGWNAAFRGLGHQVVSFNLNDRLSFYGGAHLKHPDTGEWCKAFDDQAAVNVAAKGVEAVAFEFWPDIVLVISGFFVPPAVLELFRERGMTTVMLHTESPYEDVRQMGRAALVSANVINDPTNLDLFRDVNARTWYLPQAHDPAIHYPRPPDIPVDESLRSDFAFVGTGYPSRIDFFESVDWSGIDVALGGNWQMTESESPLRKFLIHDVAACCSNDEAVRLYRATKSSANLYRQEGEEGSARAWAMGPREVELAATGTFFLRSPGGEGDEVLFSLPTFDGPDDFSEKLRWWLDPERDQVRADAVLTARAAVAPRTFHMNALQLLRLLDT